MAGTLVSGLLTVLMLLLAAVAVARMDAFQAHQSTFVLSVVLLGMGGILFFGLSMVLLTHGIIHRMSQHHPGQDANIHAQRQPEETRPHEGGQQLNEVARPSYLATVFHELRTPLTSIMGFSALVKKDLERHYSPGQDEGPKERQRWVKIFKNLGIIEHCVQRMSRLVSDMQDVYRIDTERMLWHDGPVTIQELVDLAIQSAELDFKSKPGIRLCQSVAPDMPFIQVDRDRIVQVLINLLSNAFKFSDSGVVDLLAVMQGDNLRIEVRDTGPGVAADELEMIFQAFYKSPVAGSYGRDTGLGLALCKRIIEHYQGRIWVESQLGRGSSFIFTLPSAVVGEAGTLQ